MATPAALISEQNLEAQVTGPGDATRLFIATGIAQFNLSVTSTGLQQNRQGTFSVYLGPPLTVQQFRRAIATASFAQLMTTNDAVMSNWAVTNVDAHLDEDAGKVQLEFDVSVDVDGPANSETILSGVSVQATILAAV
jgi:hypothetical protein